MAIRDARDLAPGEELTADICIIGAGPAGIVLGLELARTGIEVVVLEGGGEERSDESQDLYRGENIGEDYFELDLTRVRQFGGSTNHWEGYCRPLDREDFDRPPAADLEGWPFSRSELIDHYREASRLCEIDDSLELSGEHWASRVGAGLIDMEPTTVRSEVLFRSPPTNFARRYGPELAEADSVSIYLHANVVELTWEQDRVSSVRIAHFNGATQTITASKFVLAVGGLEVPRLLLVSPGPHGNGIGNQHDQVGRYFMEHPHLITPHLVTHDLDQFSFYTEETVIENTRLIGILTLSPELRSARAIGNATAVLQTASNFGQRWSDADPLGKGVRSLVGGLSDLTSPEQELLNVRFITEQVPNARSRVVLSSHHDPFGLPRIALDWQLHPIDYHTIRKAVETVGTQLANAGLGRLNAPTHGGLLPYRILGGNHHMGTTRLSEDPTRGVVDASLRVHGVENLYIASSSVFPTGGWANPTLTILALTLRLADHLKESSG